MFKQRMGCSFCGRSETQVAKLVAGPIRMFGRVYICDRCASQAIEVMETHAGGDREGGKQRSVLRQLVKRLGWKRPLDLPKGPECRAVVP